MTRIAVFAYASLVSPASARRTLGRPVAPGAPARLRGWARGWTLARDNLASEKTFARTDGSLPSHCLGLNLDPDEDAEPPNGVLIEVSEAELERLDLREMRYDRVEVTASIEAEASFDLVVAYRAKPRHRRRRAPEDAIIVASYPRTIEAAFAELGAGELELFRATTAVPPVPVAEATLVRDRIPEGNPRDW